MSDIPINLAVEDLLSEAVLRRLLSHVGRPFAVGTVFSREGFGYLKTTAPGWNAAARSVPMLMLTDLDAVVCPAALIESWLKGPRHANLLFRVAVREVEAWLLADKTSFAEFLGIALTHMPESPESLTDPKGMLVNLARKSPRTRLRAGLIPRPGSTAKQGPDYNRLLSTFVASDWSPSEAASTSPSLNRCIKCLIDFNPTWASDD